VKLELAGIALLQNGTVGGGHGGQAALQTPLPGILDDGIQHRAHIPIAHREGVYAFALELGKQGKTAVQKGGLLPTPHIQIGEGILTAPFGAALQIFVVFILAGKVYFLKIDHFYTSF